MSHLSPPSLGSLSRDAGQRLSQEWKKYQIGRQPVHRLQLIRSKPLCGLVLFEFQIARQNAAPVAVHGQMKRRIIIINSGDETVHADFGIKFLHDLAPERLLQGFTRFSLAPWEFPPVLEFAVPPLGDEYLSSGIADDRCYYCDSFHNGRKDKQYN